MHITGLRPSIQTSSPLSSSATTASIHILPTKHGRASTQSVEERGIIIGSTLGGTALVLVCLALVLYPIWQRRRTPPQSAPSRLSKSCPSPTMPLPSENTDLVELHRVRPVTPSPRRLAAIDTSVPSSPTTRLTNAGSMGWDVEKATAVHTPSGHPTAIVWRGADIFGNESPATPPEPEEPQTRQSEPSISTTFAAEMSSLLESISIKSSYSSLRSSGAVLGVPARLQTPLSVQKLRQDSCTASIGARRGSVSDGGVGGLNPSLRVPSTSCPENEASKVIEGSSGATVGGGV